MIYLFGGGDFLVILFFLRVSEADEVPIIIHIQTFKQLDDIQTALRPLKTSETVEINSYDYFINHLKQ